jgi:hypothetical protein
MFWNKVRNVLFSIVIAIVAIILMVEVCVTVGIALGDFAKSNGMAQTSKEFAKTQL